MIFNKLIAYTITGFNWWIGRHLACKDYMDNGGAFKKLWRYSI